MRFDLQPWRFLGLLSAFCFTMSSAVHAAESSAPIPADHARQMARGLELFKDSVGPLFKEHCVECHGGEKTKGEFDLTTREALLKGGADGLDIVVGNAKESKLLRLLKHTEEPYMPKKKPQLSDDAIAQVTAWIDAGAPYDKPLVGVAKDARNRAEVTDKDRQFWSFLPLQKLDPPAVKNKRWVQTPVDKFILAKLEAKGLQPNPVVDKRKLIRRAYLDLIGLPPTPEEVDAFLKDKSATAYDKLLDRLLENPHYGERWGRHWLDLARFGESHGYEQDYDRPFAYQYRDFVIKAFNQDMPFNQFAKWQIAGDELAPDDPLAWMATGFLAAGTHATQITANQAEKERYDELDDIGSTISTSMLGLSIGCARCHDHKFDPIPSADYYRFLSTFTTTVRSDYDLDTDPQRTRTLEAAFQREHAPLVEALKKFEQTTAKTHFNEWLKSHPVLPRPAWLTLEAEKFQITGGYYGITKSDKQADGSYLVSIAAGSPDTYTITARTSLTNIHAIRLEALADKSLPGFGPGWSQTGDFKLSDFTVAAAPAKGDLKPVQLKLVNRRATTENAEADKKSGKKKAGVDWSLGQGIGHDQALAFTLEQSAGFTEGTVLTFTLKFSDNIDRQNIGRLRLSISTEAEPLLATETFPLKEFADAQAALPLPADNRTENQRQALFRLFCTTDSEWQKLHMALLAHAQQEPRPKMVKALVSSEGLPAVRLHTQGPDYYEKTFILKRGDLAQKQSEAAQGFLQVLMRTPDKEKHWQSPAPANARTPYERAALANWIGDVDNGAGNLLARVIVNRLWQHHFGRGIVTTPSDFGSQGIRPTHPELLEWLAHELVHSGWHLKSIHKLIMTSAVYMQGTQADEARAKIDAENVLYWHRPHQRLEAEVIRDAIMSVSGRLDLTMFGPGSLDEAQPRRSIYFTIKRSKLIPMMTQFDAPDSLQGLGRRVDTTVAPQALLLLNNPQIRACAVDFAKQLEPLAKKSPAFAVDTAYLKALGRLPSKIESADAVDFLKQQSTAYGGADGSVNALTDFCQAVFGLNEFIYIQ